MGKTPLFVGGYIPDKKDKRDFPATKLLVKTVALPETFVVNDGTLIYNQGSIPKCVASTGAGVKTDQEFLQYGKQIKFDDDWLYDRCKENDGIPNEPGTYPRVACKILNDVGCKTITAAETCPVRWFKPKPPEPTPDDLYKWHIDAYYRIAPASSVEFIKQILFQYGSIMAASAWYASWMDVGEEFSNPTGGIVGGHAFRKIGWTTIGWLIANSWGGTWGKNGIAVMPFKMFEDYVLSEGDCWKLVDHTASGLRRKMKGGR